MPISAIEKVSQVASSSALTGGTAKVIRKTKDAISNVVNLVMVLFGAFSVAPFSF